MLAVARSTERPVPHAIGNLAAGSADVVGSAPLSLQRVATISRLRRNDAIFFEGDDADGYFRVVSGVVRLSKVLPDGRRHVIDFLFAGDFFGFAAGEAYDHAADAISAAVVTRYARRAVDNLARTDIETCDLLRRSTTRALVAAQERGLLLACMSATERMANFLLALARRVGARDRILLPMSRADIAAYLGLTIETVSRVIGQFKTRGLIRLVDTYNLELCDLPGLSSLAEGDLAEAA